MLAMLKNRLPAIFACGIAAGICVDCGPVAGQDGFIQQPSHFSAGEKPAQSMQTNAPHAPRQFITQGRKATAAKPHRTNHTSVNVRQLPPPREERQADGSQLQQPPGGQPLSGVHLASPDEIQWVPRAPETPRSLRLPSSFKAAPPATQRINTEQIEHDSAHPTTGQLTSWATPQPEQGIEIAFELPTTDQTPTAPNQAPSRPQLADSFRRDTAPPSSGATSGPDTLKDAPADQARQERKKAWAAMVSAESIERTANKHNELLSAVDNPEGWQSIRDRLSGHIRQCQHLLSRRAYYSAREEAQVAIKHLMQTIDLHLGGYQSEPNFAIAMTALQEAQDFTNSNAQHGQSTVNVLVGSHSSEVLKRYELSNVSPLAAAEHYRIYAADKLVEAAQNHPWASELYYTLGRIAQAESEATVGNIQTNLRWKALTMYRAAAAINPQNGIALNQLGFIFLQMDRPQDAREALVAAVQLGSTPQAATNLIAASQKLGDPSLQAWAQQRARPMRQAARPRPGANVVQVAPSAFVAMNPHVRPRPQPVQPRVQARAVGYQR